ncbi:MAG: carboxylating nicotinate-nucleotide diphosphorylase [Flavobacteriales bacterium]
MESCEHSKSGDMWRPEMQEAVDRALAEDLGAGDHTTRSSVPQKLIREGVVLAKEAGILAGVLVAQKVFQTVDEQLEVIPEKQDGDSIVPGDVVFRVKGKAWSILIGERLALNFLQRMSGIATRTAEVVKCLEGTGCRVLDTRKTTPGLRVFEKWAVRIGGGVNHRMGLDDMILIKDNHVDYAGSMTAALKGVAEYLVENNLLALPVVVEVRDGNEAQEALLASKENPRRDGTPLVHRLLLDNHTPEQAAEAVRSFGDQIPLEASGGITPQNVRAYGESGVHFVSMGWLTHSVPSLDLSLKSSDFGAFHNS